MVSVRLTVRSSHARLPDFIISSVTVRVRISFRVNVRFNNSHLSRKSRTTSYLAMRHI